MTPKNPFTHLLALVVAREGCQPSPPPSLPTGKVVAVADGDTLTLLMDGNVQVRVRLHGIDAPERG